MSESPTVLKSLLLTLFSVAFRSRLILPLAVTATFMLLDVRVRLDLELEAHFQGQEVVEEEEEEEDAHEELSDAEEVEEILDVPANLAIARPTFRGH